MYEIFDVKVRHFRLLLHVSCNGIGVLLPTMKKAYDLNGSHCEMHR